MTHHRKDKSHLVYILDKALDSAFKGMVMSFPVHGDSHDILQWFEELRLMIVEIVKRMKVSEEPKYKDLSIEKKVETIVKMAEEQVKKIIKAKKRTGDADVILEMNLPPAPLAPESSEASDET